MNMTLYHSCILTLKKMMLIVMMELPLLSMMMIVMIILLLLILLCDIDEGYINMVLKSSHILIDYLALCCETKDNFPILFYRKTFYHQCQ